MVGGPDLNAVLQQKSCGQAHALDQCAIKAPRIGEIAPAGGAVFCQDRVFAVVFLRHGQRAIGACGKCGGDVGAVDVQNFGLPVQHLIRGFVPAGRS